MKLKKSSKKIFKKSLFYLLFIYFIFAITFYYSLKNSHNISNTKFINFLLGGGNSHLLEDYKLVDFVNSSVQFLFHIDLQNPSTILSNTVIASNDKKNETTFEHNDDYSNLDELKKVSSYMEDPNPVDINNPIIYIYNSHQLENYDSTGLDIYGITPNVLMASYLFKEKLNSRGISTIVETTNLTDFLNLNNWDYSNSYRASRIFMLDKKNKYSSLKYYIDLHRDSISKNASTITIGNKSYAKILFVIGLEHENYAANLSLSEKINNLINKYYPGLSRGIYKKEGPGVDGIYNQDISENTLLIEVGGNENNIDEVLNTIEALSDIFDRYINGDHNA